MAAECNDASPVSLAAQLAGLAGDAVFELCRASLEANARLINPGPALIRRWDDANGREPVTVPLTRLCFGVTREVDRKPFGDRVPDWRQVVAVLRVMSVCKGSQLGSLENVRQLRQEKAVDSARRFGVLWDIPSDIVPKQ